MINSSQRFFGGLLLASLIVFFIPTAIAANKQQPTIIPSYSVNAYNRAIQRLYALHSQQSTRPHVIKRLLADSGYFLGKPYHLGSLGEGKAAHFDKSPLYRTNEFDCLTYVSTVLALVESNNLQQFKHNILLIRYNNGKASYLHRNHFTSVDWNPNNQHHGFIRDITKQLFPKTYKIATAVINKPSWFAHLPGSNIKLFQSVSVSKANELLQRFHNLGKKTQVKISRLPYEPLTALYNKNGKPNQTLFSRIPSGVIIEIVRPNWNLKSKIGTNLNISHLGFGVRIHGRLMYREASSIKHRVVDIPLEKYLAHYLQSPTVKGIHIENIRFAPIF